MEKRERGFETLIMITTNGCVCEIDNIKKAEISQSGRLVCIRVYIVELSQLQQLLGKHAINFT